MSIRKRRSGSATRIGAVFLCLALIFTLIPGASMPVLAEDAQTGDIEATEAPVEIFGTPAGEEPAGTSTGQDSVGTLVSEDSAGAPGGDTSVKTLDEGTTVGTLATETPASSFEYTKSGGKVTINEHIGSEKVVVIPATIEGCPVTAIDDDGYSVFADSLTAVTIPASVTEIGAFAFAYCYDLKTVTFLGKAPEVGFDAFFEIGDDVGGAILYCHIAYKSAFELALGDCLEYYGTLSTFGSLTSISVKTKPQKLVYTPGENLELTGIAVEAVYDGGLAGGTITVTLSKNDIATDPAGGTPLNALGEQTVTVKYPKTGTGQKTTSFTVTVESGEPDPTEDAAFTFTAMEDGNSYILSEYKGGHENVVVPKAYEGKPVTAIGEKAFAEFTGLKSVILPDSITSIGKEAFFGCINMKTIKLGKSVKSIGQTAFQRCNALETIELPASVEDIGWNAFGFCKKLTDIKVDAGNSKFKDNDGVLFSKDGKTLLYYSAAGRAAETYQVPDGTVRIEEDAFRMHYDDSSALKSVTYPNSLKEIGDRAFWQTKLEMATISKDITYGAGVYELCKSLKSVEVEEGVTELPERIFYGLDNLKDELILPSTLEVIGESALERYPLASIDLPENLREIGNDAFANAKITSITIPASVTKLGDRAFYINGELETVTFAEGSKLETINQYAFSGCRVLESVTLPAGLKTLGTGAFSNCFKLTSIELPDELTTLGDSVFANGGLLEMVFPDSVKTMGSYTFYGCTTLSRATLPKYLEELGEYTFQYCSGTLGNPDDGLTEVIFPDTIKITAVPAGTFIDCFRLREVNLPAVITRTEDAAFLNCVALKVNHEIPRLLRSPLDLHNFILRDESFYDLWEDGFYHTNRDLQFGETLVPAGYQLVPQNNSVTFIYIGDEANRIKPAITAVNASPGAGGDTDVFVEIIAQGIQAGDKIQIKAVHKTGGYTVTGEGIAALGKEDKRGYFVAIKTLALDVGKLEDYNISASLDGNSWVGSGGKPVQLDYIRVITSPVKAVYMMGETLDLTGLEVTATYTDKSGETLADGAYTTLPADGAALNTAGEQDVTVTYTKNGVTRTATFSITVNALDSIKVTKSPAKTVYTAGDALDLTGLEVKAFYTGGGEKVITGYTTSPADGTKLETKGKQTVTVTYNESNIEKTASFEVTVNGSGGGKGSGGGNTSNPNAGTPDPGVNANPEGTAETTTVTDPVTGDTTTTTKSSDGTVITTQTAASGHVSAQVTLPQGVGRTTVTIPTPQRPGAGDVAVIIHPDGTREVVKTSITTENGIQVTLQEGARLEIVNNSKHFGDAPAAPWAAEAVDFVSSREIFTGTSEDSFSPNAGMTRAMLMTALYRIDGGAASGNAENWYSDALKWSVGKGLSDGSDPTGNITREQLAAILYRHAGSPAAKGSLDSFGDRDQVSSWAGDALCWAVEKGLISGKGDGVLDPGGNATRAEVAAILMRYLSK